LRRLRGLCYVAPVAGLKPGRREVSSKKTQLSHKIRKTSVPSNFSAKEKLNFEKVILADSVLPRQNVRAVRPHRHFTPC
jgi:hypothetical protein